MEPAAGGGGPSYEMPPAEMIRRQPELAKWRNGQPPGPRNALGARALYLFNKGGDSGYRLHGTPEWNSIGKAMSSGCRRRFSVCTTPPAHGTPK